MFATAVRFLAKKGRGKKANKPGDMNISMEAQQWSGTLREIVKDKGPLTVASFWEHAQDTGIRSKRHMKMMLKWMRGQDRIRLVCNHLGDRRTATEKEFMYSYVVTRSERLAANQGAGISPVQEDSVPSSSDTPPTPASATPHVEDQAPRL